MAHEVPKNELNCMPLGYWIAIVRILTAFFILEKGVNIMTDNMYTIEDITGKYKVSNRYVWNLIKGNKITAYMIGHTWRIPVSEWERFIETTSNRGKGVNANV